MKQSKLMSFFESVGGTAIGFVVAFFANMLVLPWFGLSPSIADNLLLTTIYTVISIARGFGVRRLFEALHIRRPLSPFMQAVIAECCRQRDQEGWTVDHDDAHEPGDLARAGAAYLFAGSIVDRKFREPLRRWFEQSSSAGMMIVRGLWPWSWDWWKPDVDDRRHDLVRGCALGIAEGDKFDRNRKPSKHLPVSPVTDDRSKERSRSFDVAPLARNKTPSMQAGPSA